MDNFELPSHLYRIDLLTGVSNLLGFLDFLQCEFGSQPHAPLSLVALDLNHFGQVDQTHGDAALRWMAILLAEETQGQVYRIGGDEFVVALKVGSHTEHSGLAQRVFDRLNGEADRFFMPCPAATVAVIHYFGEELFSAGEILSQIDSAIIEIKSHGNRSFKTFNAGAINVPRQAFVDEMISRLVTLEEMLDETQHLAYTDALTGLPNPRAAIQQLERVFSRACQQNQPLSILLIDGDDLSRYNEISYAAGDEMIQRIGENLKRQLRPGDFLARWKVGDEFFVILPDTSDQNALLVGERFCRTIEQASGSWALPVTISVGVSGYHPESQTKNLSPSELLEKAEQALRHAKAVGKNRVACG